MLQQWKDTKTLGTCYDMFDNVATFPNRVLLYCVILDGIFNVVHGQIGITDGFKTMVFQSNHIWLPEGKYLYSPGSKWDDPYLRSGWDVKTKEIVVGLWQDQHVADNWGYRHLVLCSVTFWGIYPMFRQTHMDFSSSTTFQLIDFLCAYIVSFYLYPRTI